MMKTLKNIFMLVLLSAFLAVDIVSALAYTRSDFVSVGDINITRLHFEDINSTHTYSKNNLLVSPNNPNEWVLVTAAKQTSGVGTHSRKWVSDVPGNIYANLTFPTVNKIKDGISVLSEEKIAALAVCDVVKAVLKEKDVAIKWPNDDVVENKKISGIIASVNDLDKEQMTIGIGVNINLQREELARIDRPATSLCVEAGRLFSEEEIERLLCEIIVKTTSMLRYKINSEELLHVHTLFNEKMTNFGRKLVVVHDDSTGKDVIGIIEGIDEKGCLLLRDQTTFEIITPHILSGTLRIAE